MNSRVTTSYAKFIDSCSTNNVSANLTPNADSSLYALCFKIFGLQLINDSEQLQLNKEQWDKLLRNGIKEFRLTQVANNELYRNKPYLQLLTFTLSALFILGTLKDDPLGDEVLPLLSFDVETVLREIGVFSGYAGTGNIAMFHCILLIHARDYLGQETQKELELWIRLHVDSLNQYGFWGKADSMSHLQFQNGYHQYEVLEYLNVDSVPWNKASDAVAGLADEDGHFAPYPGGGGCYDYDAVFLLTAAGADSIKKHSELLKTAKKTILSEQNDDGGFCESHYIRPRSLTNLKKTLNHVLAGEGRAKVERIRYGLTLLRPKNDRIHTHWSKYSRRWNESDLWDSWFRMLTIARIDVAFDPKKISEWGFIDYPGIGFHPLLRHKSII